MKRSIIAALVGAMLWAPVQAQEASDVIDPPDLDGLVEVSLGDWALKNAIAADLAVKVSDVPLTLAVPTAVAETVCTLNGDDIAQQEGISPARTCAAKTFTPELGAMVRDHVAAGEPETPQ